MTVTDSLLNRRQFLRYSGATLPLVCLKGYGSDARMPGSSQRPPPAFSAAWLRKIELELTTSVENGMSGAVLHFGNRDAPVYQRAFGHQRRYNERSLMPTPQPMREDTIFDLASLTKIFSTAFAFHWLVDRNALHLDDKVSKYVPGFPPAISLRLLLGHNSGLPADYPFYDPDKVAPGMYSQERNGTVRRLPRVPLAAPPGTRTLYSDIGFITLGAVIEQVTGLRQDVFVQSEIYSKLGLRHTGYAPLRQGEGSDACEASERCGNTRDGHVDFPNIRARTIQGEVQDETAFYAMEQIAGHAGLFSTADELGVMCRLLLNGGTLGGYTLCSRATVDLFRYTFNRDQSYALGWQLLTPATAKLYGDIAPHVCPPGEAVGHTGWTGKCVIVDFRRGVYFLLLTNKKHSPVIALPEYWNLFEGDLTSAAKYGNIADLFYRGTLRA